MNPKSHERSSKTLCDLEPRRSDAVRGGRLSLRHSSVKVAAKLDLLGKKVPSPLDGKGNDFGPVLKK